MATGRRTRDGGESTWARAKPLFLAAFLAIITFIGLRLLVELRHLLILLFMSLVLAAAMSRPAAVLERRGIPRGLAVAIVQLGALAVLLVVGYIVLPPLFDELAGFAHRVPTYVDRFQGLRRDYVQLRASYPELGSFNAEVAKLADRVGSVIGQRLINLPLALASLLYQALTVLAFSTLIVMRRERIVQAMLPLVAPAPARAHGRDHRQDLGADRRLRPRQAHRHDDRGRPDVPQPGGARRPVRGAAGRDRRVRRDHPSDRSLARARPAPDRGGVRGAEDARSHLPRLVRDREPQGVRHLAAGRGRTAQDRPAARPDRRARGRDAARRRPARSCPSRSPRCCRCCTTRSSFRGAPRSSRTTSDQSQRFRRNQTSCSTVTIAISAITYS